MEVGILGGLEGVRGNVGIRGLFCLTLFKSI